jgi:LPS sulfotransferase NodH
MPRDDLLSNASSTPGEPGPAAAGARPAGLLVPPELHTIERYHREPLARLFGPNPPACSIDPSLKFLFICFTNRCGSNYLAHLIASTGVLNVAEEAFNESTVRDHAEREGLRSLHEYVAFLGRRLNMSGWLTAKVGIEQLVMLTEAGILDAIIGRTKFILIERQDQVAQAVSRLVAVQNQQWTSEQPSAIPDDQLVYARHLLDRQRAAIAFHNSAFYRFFASNGVAPKHVAYEALLQSPQQHLSDIGVWLGFDDLIGDPAALRIRRQESAVKQAWQARYRAGA